MAATLLLIAVACCLISFALDSLPPQLVDQCDRQDGSAETAVVVGVIVRDALVLRPVRMHSDPDRDLQLRKLTVRVENLLKGGPVSATITAYYFTWAGGFDGPRPLGFWRKGGRRVFWLRMDLGVLRTTCDGWDYCTEAVWSGAHVGYIPAPQKPLEYALVDLHLTRGTAADEVYFATEVFREEPDQVQGLQAYAVERLRHLALTERGDIKSNACMSLWIYTVDKVEPAVHRDAENAMHAANCHCSKKPDGNVECE